MSSIFNLRKYSHLSVNKLHINIYCLFSPSVGWFLYEDINNVPKMLLNLMIRKISKSSKLAGPRKEI